jgi:hypothetical protein
MKNPFRSQVFVSTIQTIKRPRKRFGATFLVVITLILPSSLFEDSKHNRVTASGQFKSWAEPSIRGGKQSGSAISEPPAALTSEQALLTINAMVKEIPGMSQLRILSITNPVNGLSAVAIEPPYREFPNVIIFHYNKGAKRWERASEALCLGIQRVISKVLDLHTTGQAIDIEQPTSPEAQRKFSDTFSRHGMVMVPYQRFAHLHPVGRESYYLDKRDFPKLARQLRLITEPDADISCKLFDMPRLISVSLGQDSGRFKLTGRTSNNQEWTVTFTGIDQKGCLDQKSISAEDISGKASRSI